MVDGLGPQEHVAADVADLRGYLVDDHDPPAVADGVQNPTVFIVSGTTLDCTLHVTRPRFLGVDHFGGFGSYTVMITSIGLAVVQTTCRSRPAFVRP